MVKFKTYADVCKAFCIEDESPATVALKLEMSCGRLTQTDILAAFRLTCRSRRNLCEDVENVKNHIFVTMPQLKSDKIFKTLYRLLVYTDEYDDVMFSGKFLDKLMKLRDIYRIATFPHDKFAEHIAIDCYEVLAEFCEVLSAKKEQRSSSQLPREKIV